MKNIAKLFMAVGICFTSLSCEDFLDVNDNPNVATIGDPNLLFVSELVGMSNNRTSEIWIPIGISSQVIASGGSTGWGTDEDQYNISIFSTGNTWRELYTNVIKNAKLSIDAASLQDPVNNNTIAQHKIVQAIAYWELTSIFGDIPFSEAIRADISTPKFDPQAEVLQGIVNLLDEAIGLIDVDSPYKITKEDLYYKGNMASWKKLANSLKLRVLMMMVDSMPAKSTEIVTLINANAGISSNTENALFPYFNQAGNYNPMFNIFYTYNGGVNNWLFAIDHTTDLLKDNNDPRLTIFFDPGPDATEINPVARGASADVDEDAVIGSFFLQPDSKDPIFTYAEQLLLEAEAHARNFAGDMDSEMAKANAKLRAGVAASMAYYGVPAGEAQTFIDALPDLTAGTQEEAIQVIAEQQWLDLFNRSLEAWNQWRRTEIPAMTPASGTLVPNMIRRWNYPPTEVAANPLTPAQKQLDEKMWFDK